MPASIGVHTLTGAIILSLGNSAATAQDYPVRPIRFIVPFPPGGGLDITARMLAPKLYASLGKPIVVDNRPGAGGAIGLELTARATPDGHIMAMLSASHVIQDVVTQPRFDLLRDLTAVSEVIASPYVLVANPGLPVKSVSGLVAYAKASPARLLYASAGTGSLQQLAMELFAQNAGIALIEVPYKGVAAMLPDVFTGRTQTMMSSLASLMPHIRAKSLHAIAVTSAERTPALPELPTMIESGVTGYVVNQWQGIVMPAGTPRPIVEAVQRQVARALQAPEIVTFLTNDGTRIVGSSPAEFGAALAAERKRWASVVRQTGVRIE